MIRRRLPAVRFRVGMVALALALAMLSPVSAAANEGIVDAWGEAQIKNGDKVAAKKAATADALKKCIEKVVGIQIKSEFSQDVQETVKNNQSDFQQAVRDKLTQKAEGFIQTHEVLGERIDGDIMKVHVKAQVFESKLRAEVKKLTELIAAADNPRIMVIVQEVVVKPDGTMKTQRQSLMGAHIEKALIARGFELRGQRKAKRISNGSPDKFEAWMDDIGSAAQLVRQEGGDVLIYGRVEYHNKGKVEESMLKALIGQTQLEIIATLKGMDAASGALFSSEPQQQKEYGTTFERAMARALKGSKGRGVNLVEKSLPPLLEDLKQSFRDRAEQGHAFVVVLNNVTSFRKQGRAFMTALGAVSDVSGVRQKSFENGSLTIDLSCKCDAARLQNLIFEVAEQEGSLKTLDVQGVDGRQIELKL